MPHYRRELKVGPAGNRRKAYSMPPLSQPELELMGSGTIAFPLLVSKGAFTVEIGVSFVAESA